MPSSLLPWMLISQLSATCAETCADQCVADAVAPVQGEIAMLQQRHHSHTQQQPELLKHAAAAPHPVSLPALLDLALGRKNLWPGEKKPKIQPIQDIELSKVDLAVKKPQRVAVFGQAANLDLLPHLQQCITNVGAAQGNIGSTVDVYLSTPLARPDEIPHIKESVKQATPALGMLEVQITQNKGADIGQLLQQMQQASHRVYDTILKIHTKSSHDIRYDILHQLCGSAEIAQKIIASFAANPALGLAGADGWLAWKGMPRGTPHFDGCLWDPNEQKNMKKIWSLLSPGTPMPPKDAWAAAVSSFWWSRGSSVTSNPVLLAAAPRILDNMQWGYRRDSVGRPEHALERLIATMVRAEGAVLARIRRED